MNQILIIHKSVQHNKLCYSLLISLNTSRPTVKKDHNMSLESNDLSNNE